MSVGQRMNFLLCRWILVVGLITNGLATKNKQDWHNNVIINRHFMGDIFATSECEPNFCDDGGLNDGQKLRGSSTSNCECQCKVSNATYREDKKRCVNDLEECTLADFSTNSTGGSEKIPFVFIPLSPGQVIYPTAHLRLSPKPDSYPVCVLSSTELLFTDGWHKLESLYGQDFYQHPFRLAQQSSVKTHLQWHGDDQFRQILEGKLVKLNYLCQNSGEADDKEDASRPSCIAFRVAGSPGFSVIKSATDSNGTKDEGSRLGASDYIAIGVCVGFLCIVYLVAVIIFFMMKRRRRRKERLRQQFLLPPVTLPPGLGYKSSRILGLEEAFIPELRKIEPIPGMSEENREKLHRRRLAMEEERMSRLRDHNRDEPVRNGLNENAVLEKNQKLFDAHRMYNGSITNGLTRQEGDGIEKMYVNPNFSPRRSDGIAHLVGDLPPLSPKRLKSASRGRTLDDGERADSKSSDDYEDEFQRFKRPSTVDSSGSRNAATDSSSSREIHDPMSLDSGVITTLSRSISPISSSNRGSSGRMDVEEETNVDDDQIVNLASGVDDSDRDSDGQAFFDSLRHSKDSRRQKPASSCNKVGSNNRFPKRFSDDGNVSIPFNLKMNDIGDPLAKLYDTAVLKIPKVIPSDSESLYSDCNTSYTKSRFGESDGYDKRLRLGAKKTDPLVEDPEEDLYEVIRSESDESSDSSSSICDVYVNKYMASEQDSQESGSDDDCSIHDVGGSNRQVQPDIPSAAPIKRPPPSDISSMGKMIVTISGNSEKKEASVSSGKLLIEVRDDRSLRSQVKRSTDKPKEVHRWKTLSVNELDDGDNDEGFDPDTLERGLNASKHSRHVQSHLGREKSQFSKETFSSLPESSLTVIYPRELSSPASTDYSFRLFNSHSDEQSKMSLPPELPPKTRSNSSVYSSTTPSVCSNMSDISSSEKPQVPPKVKQKSAGLTAERKSYFENLSVSSASNDR